MEQKLSLSPAGMPQADIREVSVDPKLPKDNGEGAELPYRFKR